MSIIRTIRLILILSPSINLIKSEIIFILDLNRQDIAFGETLFVNISIILNDRVQDQMLEIRLSPRLIFNASVRSTSCDSTGRNCLTNAKNIKDDELLNSGVFVFDNRIINESKQLIVFRNNINWETGYIHRTEITLANLSSSDLSSRQFVVGIFRFWNRDQISNEENGVQSYISRYFNLFPPKIDTTTIIKTATTTITPAITTITATTTTAAITAGSMTTLQSTSTTTPMPTTTATTTTPFAISSLTINSDQEQNMIWLFLGTTTAITATRSVPITITPGQLNPMMQLSSLKPATCDGNFN